MGRAGFWIERSDSTEDGRIFSPRLILSVMDRAIVILDQLSEIASIENDLGNLIDVSRGMTSGVQQTTSMAERDRISKDQAVLRGTYVNSLPRMNDLEKADER